MRRRQRFAVYCMVVAMVMVILSWFVDISLCEANALAVIGLIWLLAALFAMVWD